MSSSNSVAPIPQQAAIGKVETQMQVQQSQITAIEMPVKLSDAGLVYAPAAP